ncbi:hypothetical protein [Cronobacter dublinensis]|uniref:hypothetical protein n=1 Tax=Cronobacter dublinensis TaxID=413497 RepID=UPI000CFDE7C6|nr:hypothetical protein [Cronobacter dublinensis]
MEHENNDVRLGWLQAGWKRGAFIKLNDNKFLLEELPAKLCSAIETKENVFIVPLLYDCALIEEDFQKEPWAQVLIIWDADYDGQFGYAKNPRRLHLNALFDGQETKCLEVTALSFAQIDREVLLKAKPVASVEWAEGNLDMLLDWVAERYRQATFPDSFNTRLYKNKRRLESLWKSAPFRDYCSGIHINLNTHQELPASEVYIIKVFIVVPYTIKGRAYRDFDKSIAPEMVSNLKTRLDAIDGVEVANVEVISEREFNKEMQREYHRYSLEYYSFKNPESAPPLPAEFRS